MARVPAGACVWIAVLLTLVPAGARGTPSPCDFVRPSDARVEWTCRTIGRGESLEELFGERWVDVARFNRIDRRHAVPGTRIKVPRRLEEIECFSPMPERFPAAADDSQAVVVDLGEEFLGAYERGRLVFSAPVAAGRADNPTPSGEFRITAYDRAHRSSVYRIARTGRPYPMHFGLRFHVDRDGVSFWIHGRDLPGVPASHGCVGLYDEAMQQRCYGRPGEPVLADARRLFEWVVGPGADTTGFHELAHGPRLWILAAPPGPARSRRAPAAEGGQGGARGSRWQGDCISAPAQHDHLARASAARDEGGSRGCQPDMRMTRWQHPMPAGDPVAGELEGGVR